MNQAELAALVAAELAKMPEDVASKYFEGIKLEAAAQEAKRLTASILGGVTKVLESNQEALLAAIPVGREIRIFHRPAIEAKDGKPGEPSMLAFSVETSSAQTSTGRVVREGGKLIRITLDGKDIEGNTWRATLDKLNEAVRPEERYKIPDTPFSAHRAVDDMAKRLAKGNGNIGRLVVHGEVAPKVDPAPADPVADAPPVPEGDKK